MKRHPEAQIYAQGFEKVSLSDNSFDKSDRQLAKSITLKQLNWFR